jgi:hypothetical protein
MRDSPEAGMADSDRHERRDIVRATRGDPDDTSQPKPRRGNPAKRAQTSPEAAERREIGEPGGGAGRRDDVGRSGIYPVSGDERPSEAQPFRQLGDWSTHGNYPEGYEESGGSELIYRDGALLGGLTSDADGRPSIDIHGGDTDPEHRRKRMTEGKDSDSQGDSRGGRGDEGTSNPT